MENQRSVLLHRNAAKLHCKRAEPHTSILVWPVAFSMALLAQWEGCHSQGQRAINSLCTTRGSPEIKAGILGLVATCLCQTSLPLCQQDYTTGTWLISWQGSISIACQGWLSQNLVSFLLNYVLILYTGWPRGLFLKGAFYCFTFGIIIVNFNVIFKNSITIIIIWFLTLFPLTLYSTLDPLRKRQHISILNK